MDATNPTATPDTPRALLKMLLEEAPQFHVNASGEPHSWAIQTDVLEWLADHLQPDSVTLETGSGYSTVMFAASSRRHLAISPSARESELIRQWLQEHGVSPLPAFDNRRSQEVLPTLAYEPCDCVLIDGGHAFPLPYLDWFYAGELLKPGGYLLVDDTQIRAVGILEDFLNSETERWASEGVLGGKTAVFRKLGSELLVAGDWAKQPFNHRRPEPLRVGDIELISTTRLLRAVVDRGVTFAKRCLGIAPSKATPY